MHKIQTVAVALLCLGLIACSKDDDKVVKPQESAEQLYNEARDKFDKREYKDSVKDFEEVERQHPSSEWAINAQIMSGFASYQAEDYDTAVATLERFVKLYPNNDSTPYAYYLISLCYYEQISDVGRDQKATENAMQRLREVIRRFPDTEYARDARIKLDLTQDHLAGKEMQVGRYYERHQDYLSAINRFRYVVENFQTTSHVPEALHRLVECYLKLGIPEEAQRYAAVLGANFPGNPWYRDSYKMMTGKAIAAKPAEEKVAEDKAPEAATPEKPKSSWWSHILP